MQAGRREGRAVTACGELGRWGEDLDGDTLERAYGQAGVRASLPMWAVYPDVRDPLFNLNGLAHKVVFDAEFSYADADENFDELPLYDPLDDISIIEFRRRLFSGGAAADDRRREVRPAALCPAHRVCRIGSRRRRPKSPTT